MTPEEWFALFERTTGDRDLLQVLAAQGYGEVPPIPADSNDVRVEKAGLMLEFLDISLFPDLADGLGDGHGVLASMTFVVAERLRDPWTGPLPFELKPSDSQADLRARFGPPLEVNDTFNWDRWEIDGYAVTIEYTKDLAALKLVTVRALARTGRA